jgi:hypothetical protein
LWSSARHRIAGQQLVEDMDDPVKHGVPPGIDDGYGLGVGTTGAALTPALPISTEPNGIPVRAAPPGDTDGIAADDAALLELVPHVPEVAAPPGSDVPVPVPIAIPPPSKVVPEPDVPDEGLPAAEHVVPVPVVPAVPVGIGLRPGDASSVEPKGIPIGETGEPGVMPSGEVAPMPGVGLPIPPTCAKTGLQPKSAANIAAVNVRRIAISIVLTQQSGRPAYRASRSASRASPISRPGTCSIPPTLLPDCCARPQAGSSYGRPGKARRAEKLNRRWPQEQASGDKISKAPMTPRHQIFVASFDRSPPEEADRTTNLRRMHRRMQRNNPCWLE